MKIRIEEALVIPYEPGERRTDMAKVIVAFQFFFFLGGGAL